ncbi:site-specific integrase [Vibrio parahaemolyticus]|uniref:site-specific integrase n=1 Tax=Vibrio parahaemolyticus TaxID=670 RepID=UPI0015B8CB3F|nr:site-specific integrase [Vibrio parahaemolyticus]MBE4326216.1 site-specific integrase [Vibrio parahaemolyticus]QLE28229.1 site-specific integrase [Vibrio parahaemolyticus]HCE1880384.1 site-specific integrase [Vibrio parahaemolyticus]HCE3645061.1 site-specific integrase [Vibrio parahaemolyticus]HCE4535060.1 site-specific integrase [Vibrio parahaemolyticus]
MNLSSSVAQSLRSNFSDNVNLKAILSLKMPVQRSHKKLEPLTGVKLLDAYTDSRIKLGKSKLKNIQQDHELLTRVLHLIGFDDLNELDRSGAENVRDALSYYPTNAKKHSEFSGLTGYDVIFKNAALPKPKPCLSLTTVKGIIEKFSTFLNWSKAHGYVKDNVFYRLPKKSEKGGKKRLCFSDQHLAAIFKMKDYKSHSYLHPYYYWVPLLGRYTGARLNEICQLTIDDILQVDGVQCLKIWDNVEGQSVKNTSSIRLIPIHNELIAKGFLAFVNSKSKGRLFPELPLIKGYYSHNASKWFQRRRDSLGLGKGLDAHSFRHTFINELKQLGVSKEIIECIVGHKHNSESFDTYSEQYRPRILAPVVNMIDTSHTEHIRLYNLA